MKSTRPPGMSRMAATVRSGWRDAPLMVLISVIALASVAAKVTGPIFDVDSYWHVLMGRDIWSSGRFTGDPSWTFGPHGEWVTTQWGSEVVMAGLQLLFGWGGMTVLRVGFAAVTVAAVAVVVLRGRGATGRWFVFAASVFVVAGCAQERPATIVLPLLVVVGEWVRRAVVSGVWPRWWVVAVVTAVWANLHGSWLVVPGALTVAIVLCRLDGDWPGRGAWTAVAAGGAGLASPAGLYGLAAPFTIGGSAAAAGLMEWGRTTISDPSFVAFAMVCLVSLLAMGASLGRLGWTPLVWITGCLAVTVFAYRNIPVGALLAAPMLGHVYGAVTDGWAPVAARPGRAAKIVTALVVGAFLSVGSAHLARPVIPADVPTDLIAAVAAEPGQVRVLNDYNVAGAVMALSSPQVRVAIDGRADRYGPDRLTDYMRLLHAQPGWEGTLDRLAPTHALLNSTHALAGVLTNRGWTPMKATDNFILLRAPVDAETR